MKLLEGMRRNPQEYPKFTSEMKKTHKLLIPQMAPIHFRLIVSAVRQDGYDVEVMQNDSPEVVRQGLMYVHNDACYPALLVIGQFIDALKSGKYNVDKVALLITQTGGGCRASNYIHLLRKALLKAGFPNVPVASINFSGLERDSGFSLTVSVLRKAIAACLYGDELMALYNQISPYENKCGETAEKLEEWCVRIEEKFEKRRGVSKRDMMMLFEQIAEDFANIPVTRVPKVKVGIVGEIYVKYSPLANNALEAFLAMEDCEALIPGLLAFVQYCIANSVDDITLYGGSRFMQRMYQKAMDFLITRERLMVEAVARHENLRAPALFERTMALADKYISRGVKMGEGWLLTAEMAELVETGFCNIICAQPFGCLPNHIAGKGMIKKIREEFPQANIMPIDYDPGATRVNQENRIKLMLATAREQLRREQNSAAAVSGLLRAPRDFMQRFNEEQRPLKRLASRGAWIRFMM